MITITMRPGYSPKKGGVFQDGQNVGHSESNRNKKGDMQQNNEGMRGYLTTQLWEEATRQGQCQEEPIDDIEMCRRWPQ
jgi:hypothetical protein